MRDAAAVRRARLMGTRTPVAPVVKREPAPAPPEAPAPPVVVPCWTQAIHAGPRVRDFIYTGDLITPLPSPALWRTIVSEVCHKHGLTYLELCSHRRNTNLVTARNEAAYRLHTETTMSTPQIGRKLGGRDHTTILNSLRKFRQAMEAEAA